MAARCGACSVRCLIAVIDETCLLVSRIVITSLEKWEFVFLAYVLSVMVCLFPLGVIGRLCSIIVTLSKQVYSLAQEFCSNWLFSEYEVYCYISAVELIYYSHKFSDCRLLTAGLTSNNIMVRHR